MNSLTFDVLSHSIGDCHISAGIAGLAFALESLPKEQSVFQWQKDRTKIEVSWDGDFVEAWDFLFRQTFRLSGGIISLPGCNLTTHIGMLETLLQSPASRPMLYPEAIALESPFGEIAFNTLFLKSFVHQGFAKKLKFQARAKGVTLKSTAIPNSSSGIRLSFENAIASLFSPLTWGFYQIQEKFGHKRRYSYGLICPDIVSLETIKFNKPCDADRFVAANLIDACADYCDRNKQYVHGYQFYSRSSNRVASIVDAKTAHPTEDYIADYERIREMFPNKGGSDSEGRRFVSANPLRGAIVANLAKGSEWYEGFADLEFDSLVAEKKGLRKMLALEV
jgi:hypothetical protein